MTKPLHVKVAEALGMECVPRNGAPGMMSFVYIDSRRQYLEGNCPRYDTDWSATGPLIERYGIELRRLTLSDVPSPSHDDVRFAWEARKEGEAIEAATPLLAVCNLILKLKNYYRLSA